MSAWYDDSAEVEALAAYLLASGELDPWKRRTRYDRWPGESSDEHRMWVQLGRPATLADLPERLHDSGLPVSLHQLAQRHCHVHASDRLLRGNVHLVTILRQAGTLPAAAQLEALQALLEPLADEHLAVVCHADRSVTVYLAPGRDEWNRLPGRLRELAGTTVKDR